MAVRAASTIPHPISLFTVYAQEDMPLQRELENHLGPLQHSGLISSWSIDQIAPGYEHAAETEKHFNTAQIILLLLSASFFASEVCNRIMGHSLQRQSEKQDIRIIPIILRPVDWDTSSLNTLQILPTNGKAVTEWHSHDKAFVQIAKSIRATVLTILNITPERILTENHLHYLHWLIKRTSSLNTRGISLPQRAVRMQLEDIYIALSASYDEDTSQEETPLPLQHMHKAEASNQSPALPLSLIVSRHDHVMILGEPGSGKTTFLHYLALKHAQALCEQGDTTDIGKAHFPILLRLADYVEYGIPQRQSLSDYVAKDCIKHECSTPGLADILKTELQAGRCLVLFDGLDEIIHADNRRLVVQRIEDFVRRYEDRPNQFIITSRPAGYREASLNDTFAHYTIQGMEETHISLFLQSWCQTVETVLSPHETATIQTNKARHEIDGLTKAIQTVPGIHHLATNPLTLRILAQLHRTGAPLPRRRAELYDQITKTLTQTWRSSQGVPSSTLLKTSPLFEPSSITPLLSGLAYWLHTTKPGGLASEHEICRELGKIWSRLNNKRRYEENPHLTKRMRRFLQAVRDHTGILTEDAPQQYRFAHLTFEEYYAACHLATNRQERAQCIRTHLHDPYWQEPILLALGLVTIESPDEACKLVETAILAEGETAQAIALYPSPYESLLGQDYFFALRCLGDDIPVHDALAKRLIEQLFSDIVHQTGSGHFQKYQEALANGLGYIETSTYASLLTSHILENIEITDLSSRLWSLYSLGRISRTFRSEQVHQFLRAMLHDEDARIRSAALFGLSHMPGSEITSLLLKILNTDTDFLVRDYAVQYLGEKGQTSPQVRKTLLNILHENTTQSNIMLRGTVIKSLGQLVDTSPEVISTLINLLSRNILTFSDSTILESLRQLSQSSSEVVPLMVKALQNAEPRVRNTIAQEIETFGHTSYEAVTALRNMPPQPPTVARFQVPRCVKEWCWLPDAVEALLLSQLSSSRSGVRWKAVKAIGQLEEISERADNALLAALSDEDWLVRIQAVDTLNAFEMSSEVLSSFLSVLSNETSSSVRARIVECLGALEEPSEEVVQALLNALHDPEDHVRACVVESLMQRTPLSPEILTALLHVLHHDTFFGSRWQVIKGFMNMKELPTTAIPVIVQAFADEENAIVRQDCAQLLGQGGSNDERTIQTLLRGLSNGDAGVRKACSQALVQLGQRFPKSSYILTAQVAHIIQEHQHESVANPTSWDAAYDTLWFLAKGSSPDRPQSC